MVKSNSVASIIERERNAAGDQLPAFANFAYLIDPDGVFLTDPDGAFLLDAL